MIDSNAKGLPKWLTASAGDTKDTSSIPGSGRSLGVGNGSPLQYICMENSMDKGPWWVTVHGIALSLCKSLLPNPISRTLLTTSDLALPNANQFFSNKLSRFLICFILSSNRFWQKCHSLRDASHDYLQQK